MASESTKDLREEINDKLKGFENFNRYAHVKVLILYWEEGDHPGFQAEGLQFGELLRTTLNYDVENFSIPSRSSQLRLDSLISNAILEAEDQARSSKAASLLIIHYGGHGDRNDDRQSGEEKRSVWAAQSQGGPTLDWFQIQSKFDHADIDTLILLDCCYGAQAGRATTQVPRRVELLAAAAMDVQTPMPGPRSFTSALIKGIQESIKEKNFVVTSELHAKLAARKTNLFATPVYIRLKQGAIDRSIRLEPKQELYTRSQADLSGSLVRLLISTVEPMDTNRVTEIVEWLRTDVPRLITKMHVEEVVHATAQICDALEDRKITKQLSLTNTTTQDEIIEEWNRIKQSLEAYQTPARPLTDAMNIAERSAAAQDILRQAIALPQKLLEKVYDNIFDQATTDEATLEMLLDNPTIVSAGLAEKLRLYKIAQDSSRNSESLFRSLDHIGKGVTESHREYRKYRANLDMPEIEEAMHRVGLLADLLNAPKGDDFRSLKCLEWFHEPDEHRFTLVFGKIPKFSQGNWRPTTLQNVIIGTEGSYRPSLGQRFNIALKLAKALQRWHSFGWVHQGISSANVILFLSEDENVVDYDEPFLQGFEFSRPNQAPSRDRFVVELSSDVYKHPSRQGPSREGHRKTHDMYSLGVVLLEIGMWQSAMQIATQRQKQKLAVSVMKDRLQLAASERLSHYAGVSYQQATLTCLGGEFNVEFDDRLESNLAKSFQAKVIDPLSRSARLI